MNLKTLISTFAVVFLAELGDKTQLATLAAAGAARDRWAVFAGACLALVAASAIAVVAAEALGRLIPPIWTRRAAGLLMLALGSYLLLVRGDP